jgi:hypothetical protein
MDQQRAESNRRSARKPVLLAATIEVAGAPVAVTLRNLSEEGALIEGTPLPPVGTTTWFERGMLRLVSEIVWTAGNYAGIRFARRLDPAEVLRHIATPKAQPDWGHRRPALTRHDLSPTEQRIIEEWGRERPAPRRD